MKGYFVIIGTLVLIVSVLVTLNIFFQQSLQLEMAEQFNQQQLMLARSIARNISAYVSYMQEEMLSMNSISERANLRTTEDYRWLADSVLRDKSIIKERLGVIDAQGKVYFLEGKSSEFSGDAIDRIVKASNKVKSGQTLILATPSELYILSPLGNLEGARRVAFLAITVEDIADYFIGNIKAGETGHASIIDRAGNLLYHHPNLPEMAGKNVYRADENCLKCHGTFDLEKKILEGQEGENGRYIAPSGENKIMAFALADVGTPGWVIAVSSPFSEVTFATKESMKLYSYLIISILTTTIIVSALLIIFNKKRIEAAEIEKRREAMERYAIELEEKVRERTSELFGEKEKLDSIVSAIGSGIILFSKEGVIQWANQAMRDMAGRDVVGLSCEQLCADCEVRTAFATTNDIETVIMSNLFGNEGRYYQVITASVKGSDGEIHGYIRLIQDVTEMKRMEEQMTNSEKLASIGRLAAGIAHEIGNPLTSIFSFVQILREVETDEFKKDSLQTVYFHINRISEILKQLSGFTRMPVGDARQCRVNEVIESSINLIQYDKKAKDIRIVKELSPTLPEIVCDCNQLSQVFVNLILNAIDAMPSGGTLTVRSFSRDDHVVMQFQDTGVGIPRGALTKIFDPFYTTKEKGTGLGLAVSYNIVKKMGGVLSVDSEVNEGTTFTVDIPTDCGEQVMYEAEDSDR